MSLEAVITILATNPSLSHSTRWRCSPIKRASRPGHVWVIDHILEEERLSIVKKHFGDVPLSAITATAIADFQRARHDAGIANRTIDMDVGVLSRVLKFCGRWRALADHVKNLPERQRPIGRALTSEERRRLFDVAASNPEWAHVYCAAIIAANTSMRPVEVKHIRRCDVDQRASVAADAGALLAHPHRRDTPGAGRRSAHRSAKRTR